MSLDARLAINATVGGQVLSGSIERTGSVRHQLDEVFAAGSNTPHALAFDGDDVSILVMVATVDMTVEVNNATTPDATFNLKANHPYVWDADSGYATNPLAGVTVANLYITNATTGRLKVAVLMV